MVTESRLKEAFRKIKDERDKIHFDLNQINNRLERYERSLELTEDIRKQLKVLDRVDVEKFVKKLDSEINLINSFMKDVNERSEFVNDVLKKLNHQLEFNQSQIEDLNDKLKEVQSTSKTNRLDVKVLDEYAQDIERMLEEKISLEVGQLRLELQSGLAETAVDRNIIQDKLNNMQNTVETHERSIPEIFENFSKIVNDRVNNEMKEVRSEMKALVNEIRNETKEFKKSLKEDVKKNKALASEAVVAIRKVERKTQSIENKASKKKEEKAKSVPVVAKKETQKEVTKKESEPKKKVEEKKVTKTSKKSSSDFKKIPDQDKSKEQKDGAFTRAVKWLFVDEEEDQTLNDVKSSVKAKK